MTDPVPDPFPWFPLDKVLAWLKVARNAANADRIDVIEDVRLGACQWIEDQRPDLRDDEDVFQATYRVLVAARLAITRLLPDIAGFQELGAGGLLKDDAKLRETLGRPKPVIG